MIIFVIESDLNIDSKLSDNLRLTITLTTIIYEGFYRN